VCDIVCNTRKKENVSEKAEQCLLRKKKGGKLMKLGVTNLLKLLGLGVLLSCFLFAQTEQVGGPYEVDEHTVLLMHFEGNLSNESDSTADGQFVGDESNFYFLPNVVSGLGQCLRIDNDSKSDSAYVIVPDTSSLDLTGDWTIEGWINIFTFGEGPSDWRWVPRLVIKTGDEVFWRPNYFVEMWGSSRFFSCGYHTASQDAWPQANSPDNTMVPGQWYHLAFIRDTNRHLLLTIVHNANRELVAFSTADYLSFGAADPTPITTNQPLHIGYAGGGEDSFLDGFVDEIRISNVVREFPIPPIITGVTELPNQTVDVTEYHVGARIFTLFESSTVQSAQIYYNAGSGWNTVDMTVVDGDSMAGVIPAQPLGTVVNYYVKATDSNGLSYTQPQNAETDSVYYTFGVYSPNTQVLDLTFEEGSGNFVDNSAYGCPVTPVGSPKYSTKAAVGSYSVYLEGDSSYLEVDSPFLTNEEFCVDFWFKADSIRNYCRILNRPANDGTWWENTYQIRFDDAHHLQAISDGSVSISSDVEIDTTQWYHVIYEVQKAEEGDTCNYYAGFQISDLSGNVLFKEVVGFDTPVLNAARPLRIGKAAYGDYPPYFCGYFDDIKIYNYPAAGIITSVDENDVAAVRGYRLHQNYPNPFNPNTSIRFEVPRRSHVELSIYDVLGRKIRTLVNENMPAGKYSKLWDGKDELGNLVPSGIYFYRLKADNFDRTMKMVFVR